MASSDAPLNTRYDVTEHNAHGLPENGEKIFKLLTRLEQEPKRFQDSLEFIYICLCMGLRGKYALKAKGDEHLQAMTEELSVIISELRGPPPRPVPRHAAQCNV
ncbi:type IVB secretion system protein IcmH/DotU [Pseudomonas sp. PSKL.D1]|uniref:type IVB secretion system protein IcmH/DotU n=1 Tax=Pseudomonas sp. PSKL.D1 TaxID=3029060 RepID=UPI002380FC9A|nr:type IVB secretion system protein IcmH/DotU [Pseudomonas sp. PSKL.D1]WDY56611.1 type IVB secretion system protein IcmH/DotU [Pseudomonas sp. PSKL.D1]